MDGVRQFLFFFLLPQFGRVCSSLDRALSEISLFPALSAPSKSSANASGISKVSPSGTRGGPNVQLETSNAIKEFPGNEDRNSLFMAQILTPGFPFCGHRRRIKYRNSAKRPFYYKFIATLCFCVRNGSGAARDGEMRTLCVYVRPLRSCTRSRISRTGHEKFSAWNLLNVLVQALL